MAYTLTSPISVTIGGVAHSLVRINQDTYGSEYLDRNTSSLYEVRMKIRHAKEAAKTGQVRVDRHNVELTKTIYGTDGAPDKVIQTYVVIRNPYNQSAGDVEDVATGLVGVLTSDNFMGLVAWQN